MNAFDAGFEELEPGTAFTTRGRTVTEADVAQFAALSGDTHPQHTDAEWAGRSRFGQRIAHGMLVLSYAAGLVPFDPERVVALRRIGDAVFKRPVKIGDTVHVEGEIDDTRELDDEHGVVSLRWRVKNQRDKLVLRATVEAIWRRGEQAAATAGHEPAGEQVARPVLI